MTYKVNPELKEQSPLEKLVDAAYRNDTDIRKAVLELMSTYQPDDIATNCGRKVLIHM